MSKPWEEFEKRAAEAAAAWADEWSLPQQWGPPVACVFMGPASQWDAKFLRFALRRPKWRNAKREMGSKFPLVPRTCAGVPGGVVATAVGGGRRRDPEAAWQSIDEEGGGGGGERAALVHFDGEDFLRKSR